MAEDTGVQTQRPALIIGLGGTGKQVLLNFRRMYYERYAKKHPSYVGHIWIDTDPRNVLLDGKEMDFLMKEVDFDEDEKVDVELNKADLQNFYDQSHDYPHIFSWFDKRLTQHGHILNGAGGIRSFGRLAFFRCYDEIMNTVRVMHGKISNADTHNQALTEQDVMLEGDALDVWLIFSVAGGTGAGMFLDMAFALRDRWPNVQIRSMILLPSVFSNNQKNRYYANSYSALMELEYYQSGNRFPIAWTREMYEQDNSLQGPVFDHAFLIDNSPASKAGSLAIEDKNALCRMLAEWLYIEYGTGNDVSGLGAERRMKEVNFSTALNQPYSYTYHSLGLEFTEEFSCRYLSFGLSKIYIPVDRIETLVEYRLVQEFIEFWTVNRPIPTNLDELLEGESGYYRKVGINNRSNYRDFIRALEAGNNAGKRLGQRLEAIIHEKRGQFLNMANSAQVRQRITQWQNADLLKEQLYCGETIQENWGTISKSVVQNLDQHYGRICKKLQELVTDLLTEPRYRFEVAREVLRRMRDSLIKDAERFETMEEKNRRASQNNAKQAQKILQWLDDVKGNFSRKTIIEVALEEIERQSKRELQAQISGAAAGLANQLANYIGLGVKELNAQGEEITVEKGLIKQLTDYHKALREKLLGRLNERIHAFNKIEVSPIYQELSQGVEEIDLFYVDQNNRPISENTLTDWERRFFENSPKIENLWEMRHQLERGENKLLETLLAFSNETMSHVKDKQVDTIERLTNTNRADSAQYHAVVARLLNYAQPWLPEPSHFVDTALTSREYAHWVARYDSSGSEAHESFNQKVKQLDQDYKFVDSSPDRIYAAAEVAGFPLMLINNLDRYRNDAYLPYLEKNEVLHTDLAFEKFQDLLIKRPEEIQSYIETLNTFLRASLLGIINANQSNVDEPGSLMEYSYIDKSQIFPETIDLGAFSVAISRLSRSREQDLLRRIQSDVVNAINDMNDENLRKWTALLSFHAGGGEKASYYNRFPRNHVVRAIFRQEAESLINQNGDRMKQAAQTEMENLKRWALERPTGQQIWAVEGPQGSGLFVLESWRR